MRVLPGTVFLLAPGSLTFCVIMAHLRLPAYCSDLWSTQSTNRMSMLWIFNREVSLFCFPAKIKTKSKNFIFTIFSSTIPNKLMLFKGLFYSWNYFIAFWLTLPVRPNMWSAHRWQKRSPQQGGRAKREGKETPGHCKCDTVHRDHNFNIINTT